MLAFRRILPKPERHVLVCINERPADNPKGSCAARGSVALYEQLKSMAKDRGLARRVIVSRASCLKHCSRGVTVAVYPDNVWYAGVTPQDLAEICDAHLRDGEPVARLAMPDIPWE
jgi:(2Fe-2S) ferredoxin